MKFPPQSPRFTQKTINPIFVAIESQQQETEKGAEFRYPRHIFQYQPQLDNTAPKVIQIDNSADFYTELEQRNLCPRLNYYQSPNQAANQVAKLHLNNIRQNLKQRIDAARKAGNVELVDILEQEWQELSIH
ncbi:MAG: hypothetical protein VKJ02_17515 [Snowella sp.]|nr:hypothetical protein [Snowella sp.]